MRYHFTSITMAKIQTTDNTKCCKGTHQQELYLLLVGMQNGTPTLENGLSLKNYSLTIWSSNHTTRYLPNWVKDLCPHMNLDVNVYNTFIYKGQTLEVFKMTFSKWMNKQTVIYSCNGILFNDIKKWANKPQKDMDESWICIAT